MSGSSSPDSQPPAAPSSGVSGLSGSGRSTSRDGLTTSRAPILGDQRKYRITSILGQGGFGTVYRARLEGSEGFQKDVAIKILRDAEPPADILARFRDEARILGLVRNPHVVSVDPPVKLDGRWAVVMEYVDGASCEELLQGGVLPPTIVLELAEVIATTLTHLYEAQDDQGRGLALVHRDLKPSNIQVTPTGHVKLLDFGVARANFDMRETETVAQIGGTPGYIAPERLEGHDGPEGDIYSLGVVMHRLVTRQRPPPLNVVALPQAPPDSPSKLLGQSVLLQDPRVKAVVELAAELRNPDHTTRPTGRQVAEKCRALRMGLMGAAAIHSPPVILPELRTWASDHVAAAPKKAPDEMVGRTLSETMSHVTRRMLLAAEQERRQPGQDPMLAVGLASVLFGLFLAFLGVLMIAGLGAYSVKDPEGFDRLMAGIGFETHLAPPPPVPAPAEPSPAPAPVVPAPAVEPEPAPAPAPAEPAPEPKAAPKSVPRPSPHPSPAPRPAEPAPAPAPAPVATGTVQVTGDATSVQLVCGGATYAPGAPVPAGACDLHAVFGGGAPVPAGRITVPAGGKLTVQCVAAFQRCRAK